MQSIDFNDLASGDLGITKLFTDFITDPSRVKDFFPRDYRHPADWRAAIQEVQARTIDRSALVKILSRQNRDLQCGVKTLANIDLLLNDNAVAIVTGQQVGLFTGPMYTLYKTITTLSLAQNLARQFPDTSFVPVFWLEGEDHDIAEIASVHVPTASNDLATYTYPVEGAAEGKNLGSVGRLQFTESIQSLFAGLRQGVTQTEFTEAVFSRFQVTYQPGMTFTKAFVLLMNTLLEDSGLVFLDPSDLDAKRLIAPIFRRELTETPAVCQAVIAHSDTLEDRYHAQVKPRPVNAFLHYNEGRYPIEPHPNGFGLKGVRKTFSRDEMLALLDEHPDRFSPNVVLRPICQDTLLPTLAYVGGPAEIAYFAQLMPLYSHFALPAPMIYPRASATIIEEKVDKVLTKFGIRPVEMLTALDEVKQRVATQNSEFKTDELFGATTGSIQESLNMLRSGLHGIDPTLVGALDNALQKIVQQVDVLKQKTVAAQQRQNEVTMRQIDKAGLFLRPHGGLQERTINVFYYLNKYGPDFVRWLAGELSAETFRHQLIRF